MTPPPKPRFSSLRVPALLLLLAFTGILIHGYHVGVEDQEVYLAAIKKNLDPSLYPVNAQFFTEQMKASVFIQAVAYTVRILHSVPWALFLWHIGSTFLILLGCWKIASFCFADERERWAGVMLVVVLFTLPLAGTALYPLDQYLHPRAPATGAALMAVAACFERKWVRGVLWLLFSAAMHPLMALFGASLMVFVSWPQRSATKRLQAATAALLPLQLFQRPSEAWNAATLARTYYFPLQWEWYEWLGLIAPVLLVWWFGVLAKRRGMRNLEFLAGRVFAFAVFQFAVAAFMTMPPATRQMASLQPMRWLHIFYFIFLLMAGGLAARFVFVGRRAWAGIAILVVLSGVMFFVQRDLFEHSDHIEWPGRSLRNPWANAFLWIRTNTPKNAVFATDPKYMDLRGEDAYGFRALSERSMLAEDQKDPGAATVFPALAPLWLDQVRAQRGIEKFSREQFVDLEKHWGATWVVLPANANVDLECPYSNEAAKVCRIDATR